MKAVILAGGFGSRLSEETHLRPKPMVEVGGRPILWHIMKNYSVFGINDFVICCGYKGYMIKEYFANYALHASDVTFDLSNRNMTLHDGSPENWKVTLVDTGENTATGGRLKRVSKYVGNETFCFTYGDGLSNVDLNKLINHHRDSKRLATITAVQPPGRFGSLSISGDKVHAFKEKPDGDGGWINAGFFVLEPGALNYIEGDSTVWEHGPSERLANDGQLAAYKHSGYWHAMDTLRDRNQLNELWLTGNAPWKLW